MPVFIQCVFFLFAMDATRIMKKSASNSFSYAYICIVNVHFFLFHSSIEVSMMMNGKVSAFIQLMRCT